MSLKEKSHKESIQNGHKTADYIKSRLKKNNWSAIDLARNSKLSQGEISKILKGTRIGLSAKSFYYLYTAFKDSCSKATKEVYPELDFKLNKYIPKTRNNFGKLMLKFEESKNSLEEISIKTGIEKTRMTKLYYGKGSLEAFELLLIEKAVGKKQGELFELLYA